MRLIFGDILKGLQKSWSKLIWDEYKNDYVMIKKLE